MLPENQNQPQIAGKRTHKMGGGRLWAMKQIKPKHQKKE
jgi:hypothetical protein